MIGPVYNGSDYNDNILLSILHGGGHSTEGAVSIPYTSKRASEAGVGRGLDTISTDCEWIFILVTMISAVTNWPEDREHLLGYRPRQDGKRPKRPWINDPEVARKPLR